MATSVSVAIYDVFDVRDPNHWAIHLDSPKKGHVILQVQDEKKGVGYYVAPARYGKSPEASGRYLRSYVVGHVSSSNHDAAETLILGTPVDNNSNVWNCQAWVVEALDSLERNGLFKWDKKVKAEILSQRQDWQ